MTTTEPLEDDVISPEDIAAMQAARPQFGPLSRQSIGAMTATRPTMPGRSITGMPPLTAPPKRSITGQPPIVTMPPPEMPPMPTSAKTQPNVAEDVLAGNVKPPEWSDYKPQHTSLGRKILAGMVGGLAGMNNPQLGVQTTRSIAYGPQYGKYLSDRQQFEDLLGVGKAGEPGRAQEAALEREEAREADTDRRAGQAEKDRIAENDKRAQQEADKLNQTIAAQNQRQQNELEGSDARQQREIADQDKRETQREADDDRREAEREKNAKGKETADKTATEKNKIISDEQGAFKAMQTDVTNKKLQANSPDFYKRYVQIKGATAAKMTDIGQTPYLDPDTWNAYLMANGQDANKAAAAAAQAGFKP
ncbi:MAG: hypothetical protein ACRD8A_12635 [Candidatus Acidiferrales bacterium]